jgi:ATP-dependent Clp protease ATP-binding subunit ClpA
VKWFELFGGKSPGGANLSGVKFTPRAQQVLALSRKEAERLNHNFVGTEHLLLGLMKLGDQCVAVKCLGLDLETVRKEVERQVGTGPVSEMKDIHIPYTPRVKKVLALAARDAKAMNHNYVGTEHLLLGLMSEGDGVAPRVLKNLGVDLEKTRLEMLKALNPESAHGETTSTTPTTTMKAEPQIIAVDTSKRYDVYCSDRVSEMVVYRNALFKGRRKLLSTREHDFGGEFLELEQSNGQTIFLSLISVRKFCEHGGEMTGEKVDPK